MTGNVDLCSVMPLTESYCSVFNISFSQSSCVYYKSEFDTAYTQLCIAEECDSSLYIGVIRIHKANFHVRNNAVLGD